MPTVTKTETYNLCRRCAWMWRPRLEKSKICPHCKREDWDEEGPMKLPQDAN